MTSFSRFDGLTIQSVKSTIGYINPLYGISSPEITCLEIFRYNPKSKVDLCLIPYCIYFQCSHPFEILRFTVFVRENNLDLIISRKNLAWVCHSMVASFLYLGLGIILSIVIMEIHPPSKKNDNLLNLLLPLHIFISPYIIVDKWITLFFACLVELIILFNAFYSAIFIIYLF